MNLTPSQKLTQIMLILLAVNAGDTGYEEALEAITKIVND